MKHFLLLTGLASASFPALAQEHPAGKPVVSIGVYGPSANLGLQAEQPLGRHFSLGARASRQFNSDFRGYQGGLIGRYYFRPNAPTGLFLQATAKLFDTKATVTAFYPGSTSSTRSERTVKGSGIGLGLGYQWRFAQHLVATVGLGLKVMPNGLGKCDCAYERDWYAVGQPGSVLDGQLSFGYAF